MKKILTIVLVFALVLLVSCASEKPFREDVTCEDILNAAVDATEHPDADKIYLKREANLDSTSFALWVDGLYEESDDFALISDYAIFVSAGTTTYEVAVLKVSDIALVEQLKDLMLRRKDTLTFGDKGMYDPNFSTRMSNSKIITNGEYVILLITDDNDAAVSSIEKLK